MEHAQNGAIDSTTLRSWYDDFDNRWAAYTKILGRLRELAVLQLTSKEFDEQAQFVDRLVEQMLVEYDRDGFREMCAWVQEQRQQTGWLAPRLNDIVTPTALQLELHWFLFVGGTWRETMKLGFSGKKALEYFNDCLNLRPPPDSNELHVLLSDEHTLARRALNAMAVPTIEHNGPAPRSPLKEKQTIRDKQIKHLCKANKLAEKWAELLKLANDDPIIQGLGLNPLTYDIVVNVMKPKRGRKK